MNPSETNVTLNTAKPNNTPKMNEMKEKVVPPSVAMLSTPNMVKLIYNETGCGTSSQAPKIIVKVIPPSGAKLSPLCMTGLIDNEGCLQVIRGFVGGFPKLATNRKQKAVFIELLTQLKSLVLQKLLRRIVKMKQRTHSRFCLLETRGIKP